MWKTTTVLMLMVLSVAAMASAQGTSLNLSPRALEQATAQEQTTKPDQAAKPDDDPDKVQIDLGVTVVADFYFNTSRPVGAGVPFYLEPRSPNGLNQATFDANARATMLTARLSGPRVGNFDLTARVQAFLYDPVVINDKYGILPFAAVVQIKDSDWLFSAGLQLQIFNPIFPTMLTWSRLGGSGNAGAGVIGQARVERYLRPSEKSAITLTGGVSEPIATTYSEELVGSEDNGWPNVEGRATFAFGALKGEGPAAQRPFEFSASGVVGQIRTTSVGGNRVITDMWGLGSDARWSVTPRFGFVGEAYTGQSMGVWTGGILQTKNPETFEGLHTKGGWIEGYYYWRPEKLHTHVGYGIDRLRDEDLAPGQKRSNETYFGNLIWDVTKRYRVGGELTYRKTAFKLGGLEAVNLDNDGIGFQSQVSFKF